jgi:hypothetical protein
LSQARLAFWNESPIWDPQVAAPLEIPLVVAHVSLPRTRPLKAIDVIDAGAARDLGTRTSVTVEVGAHPVILRLE